MGGCILASAPVPRAFLPITNLTITDKPWVERLEQGKNARETRVRGRNPPDDRNFVVVRSRIFY
jgi:hypothetical protein